MALRAQLSTGAPGQSQSRQSDVELLNVVLGEAVALHPFLRRHLPQGGCAVRVATKLALRTLRSHCSLVP